MKLLRVYLVLSAIVAHLLAAVVLVHYRSTGASRFEYVSKVVTRLDRDSSPTRHVARFVRLLLLDSGLVSDPGDISLPVFPGPDAWPATGPFRSGFAAVAFASDGRPMPAATAGGGQRRNARMILVDEVEAFRKALREAAPGDVITLAPGRYEIRQWNIKLGSEGKPDNPITVRAASFGEVQLELDSLEGFYVDQPYWVFENLQIRGICERDDYCEHAFHVVGDATGTTIRNNELVDFNAALKVNGLFDGGVAKFPEHGLVQNNSIFNTRSRRTANPVTLLNINGGNGWVVSANFIADFAKGRGDGISYGAFMKSNSRDGVFERNLVVCHWNSPVDDSVRIGLSFGGGGSDPKISRGGTNLTEHTGGIMRNNVIARCPRDVGIYLNRASSSRIQNNLLVATRGIDVRFETSTALIVDNVLDGRLAARDGGTFRADNNLIAKDCGWISKLKGQCGTRYWYAAPLSGDLRLAAWEAIAERRTEERGVKTDFCGSPRSGETDIGPFQYGLQSPCLP